jgi:spore coat protein A
MPILLDNLIDATGGLPVNLTTELISRKLHSQLPPTTLFGYLRQGGPGAGDTGASYLGPVIVAKYKVPVVANYTNNLASNAYLSVFTNNGSSYAQFNPFRPAETRILTHLHGAIDSGDSDGNPFATPAAYPSGMTQTATYPNEQAATLSWYHDHLLGDTRMNVVGGLAGGYLLHDPFDSGDNPLLPSGAFELPMVVQDRMFNADGSLLYPVAPLATNGPWIGEYFGDVMMSTARSGRV